MIELGKLVAKSTLMYHGNPRAIIGKLMLHYYDPGRVLHLSQNFIFRATISLKSNKLTFTSIIKNIMEIFSSKYTLKPTLFNIGTQVKHIYFLSFPFYDILKT